MCSRKGVLGKRCAQGRVYPEKGVFKEESTWGGSRRQGHISSKGYAQGRLYSGKAVLREG